MNRNSLPKRAKRRRQSIEAEIPSLLMAALCGGAIAEYTEFVFFTAKDNDGRTADIAMWRVHMGSACLGSIAFIVALFCFETLKSKSKSLAVRSAVPWLPIVVLTGCGAIIHIPVVIVIALAVINGIWAYRLSRTQRTDE